VEIGEVRIEGHSVLVGKTIADSTIRRQTGVIILGVKPVDGALLFNPSPETMIRASDTLIVLGADSHLRKLEALASAAVRAG